jgi:hypothetical protein
MENEETHINARTGSRGLRGAGGRVLLFLEEHVLWPVEDAVRAVFGSLRGVLDRPAWLLQRWLIWPLQDRFALLGRPGRVLLASGGVALAAAACLSAYAVVTSGGSGDAATPVAAAPSEPPLELSAAAADREPAETLHGAAPVFEPKRNEPAERSASDRDASEQTPSTAARSDPPSSSAATDTISSSPSSPASASTSTVDGPPAGPKALAVAREFADAFVVYETGGEKSAVRGAFAATATPQLARSLLRRPPRLPANVAVPKAKVLNVIAGPSHGGVYTVSVSLLRVGVSSELRLDMEKLQKDGWQVTNVLG